MPVSDINTSTNIEENIINNRNNDIMNAINNYKYPSNKCKILLKINTNRLKNNKYLVYKISGDKSNRFEITETELQKILEIVSFKKTIRIEYLTESLNSNNDLNDNFYEINNTKNTTNDIVMNNIDMGNFENINSNSNCFT